jgi:ribosome-associated heat shock protein Hsp15
MARTPEAVEVRLDKWLQIARIFKTRTQAADACSAGRVALNGAASKPHRNLRVGDRIEIERDDWTRILIVKELRDRPVSKAQARELYEDQSPPRPQLDPLEQLLRRPPVLRPRGSGRPTKRERRQIGRLKDRD